MSGYLIDLNLRGKSALVVGLGNVGTRKAAALLAAGARVVAVDPSPPPDTAHLDGIELVAEPYCAEHLVGISLVIASAFPDVNERVVSDSRQAGIWVASASDPASADFSVPAVWSDGLLSVAVSTSGASPSLAAVLRDRAAAAIGPAAPAFAAALADFRREVLARITDPSARRRLLTACADPTWLALWETDGPAAVQARLAEALAAADNCIKPPHPPSHLDLPGL